MKIEFRIPNAKTHIGRLWNNFLSQQLKENETLAWKMTFPACMNGQEIGKRVRSFLITQWSHSCAMIWKTIRQTINYSTFSKQIIWRNGRETFVQMVKRSQRTSHWEKWTSAHDIALQLWIVHNIKSINQSRVNQTM